MTTETVFIKKYISYKYKLSFLVAIVFSCFARLMLQGSGWEDDLYRYIVPILAGTSVGYLTGYLLDNWQESLQMTEKSNTRLRQEIQQERIRRTWHAALFEKNHSILLLINPETGNIEEANPSACAFYGYSLEQLRKMHIAEIDTLSVEAIHKELQRAAVEKRQKLISRHKLASKEERDVELFSGSLSIDGKVLLFLVINDITREKTLDGIIPVCSHCRQVRDRQGDWSQMEEYIMAHSDANFSHGLCPHCAEEHYPTLYDMQKS